MPHPVQSHCVDPQKNPAAATVKLVELESLGFGPYKASDMYAINIRIPCSIEHHLLPWLCPVSYLSGAWQVSSWS